MIQVQQSAQIINHPLGWFFGSKSNVGVLGYRATLGGLYKK